MAAAVDKLSPRQRECLRMHWARQATSKEIASELGVSHYTVDGYFKEAIETLGAKDRRDAARIAFGTPPEGPGDASPGVPTSQPWRSLLPLRTGAHNDLSIPARLFWIFFLAALLAIGFGALASGAHLLNDLFRRV